MEWQGGRGKEGGIVNKSCNHSERKTHERFGENVGRRMMQLIACLLALSLSLSLFVAHFALSLAMLKVSFFIICLRCVPRYHDDGALASRASGKSYYRAFPCRFPLRNAQFT